MGYYSFYRIIKDILYNLKKNKILVVIAIIILVLFLCNNVFASSTNSYDFTFHNENYTFTIPEYVIDNNYNYFFLLQDYNNGNSFVLEFFVAKGNITATKKHNNTYGDYYTLTCSEGIQNSFSFRGDFYSNYPQYTNNLRNALVALYNSTEPSTFRTSLDTLWVFTNSNTKMVYFTNTNIRNSNGDIIFTDNSIKFPQITTALEDLQTLNFDTISVSAWNWSNKDLYILFYDRTLMNNNDTQGLYPKKEIKLTTDTSYYIPEISSEQNAIYWVANDNTGLNFKVGGKYEIRLAERVPQSTGRWFSWRRFV